MVKYTFLISGEFLESLRSYRELSVSEHIRKAIQEYLRKYERLNTSTSKTKRGDYYE